MILKAKRDEIETYSTKHTGPFERIRFANGRLPGLLFLFLVRCWLSVFTLCRSIHRSAVRSDMRKPATVIKFASSLKGEELADRFTNGRDRRFGSSGSGGRG